MSSNGRYREFLQGKSQLQGRFGFDPVWMPEFLFPFQRHLVEWATQQGRAAIFADCGLGKTFMQLVWAENVARKTGRPVLILTPLAVAFQTVREGAKVGIEVAHRRDQKHAGDRIVVTNYERLDRFDASDYAGVVCDESSILKNFAGATRQQVTEFMASAPYRLLCTATAAPNDYVELGTSSEALGIMERKHMLSRFFTHDGGNTSSWRLKGHARSHLFWRWMCSWARACRRPSDLGYSDDGFVLPPLNVREHIVGANSTRSGYLFDVPAIGLDEQRQDLRRTVNERCEYAANLINQHDRPAIAWCNLNDEGTTLQRLIPGAEEVSGSDLEQRKEDIFLGFVRGDIRVLVTKPSIGGFGLNLQHCAHQTYFPSHSYEMYYQAVRRCWRFGQQNPVTVDMITTEGQGNVLANLQRKAAMADEMFTQLVETMQDELRISRQDEPTAREVIPTWL